MKNGVFSRGGATGLCLATLGFAMAPGALALEARIDGLQGDVADNVRFYLQELDASQYTQRRLEGEVQQRTRVAMRAYGYYEPQVQLRFDDNQPPEYVELAIDPGSRVTVQHLDVRLEGDAATDTAFTDAVESLPLTVGDPLLHAPWDRMRNRLANLSLERGYFDWSYTDRRMEVRPFEESARLFLTLDSRQRYAFGDITLSGHHIDETRLRNLAPFEPGEDYLASDVALYTQRLGQTNWFSSVSVRPRLDARRELALPSPTLGWWNAVETQGEAALASGPSARTMAASRSRLSASALATVGRLHAPQQPSMPIDVVVAPADRHRFEVGVGFATDVGPRLRFAWHQS